MKKDLTKLESYDGMTWDEASDILSGSAHMLALGKDALGLEVAKTFSDYGLEVGTATLTAATALKKNGLEKFVTQAVGVYKELAREIQADPKASLELKGKADTLAHEVYNMEFMVFFMGKGHTGFQWAVKPSNEVWGNYNKRAGLANVMLMLAAREMNECGTCGQVATLGIMRFLERGSKGK